jgi:hypothetical protein
VKDLEQKLIIKAVSGSCRLSALSIYFPIGNSKNTRGEWKVIDVFEVMARCVLFQLKLENRNNCEFVRAELKIRRAVRIIWAD